LISLLFLRKSALFRELNGIYALYWALSYTSNHDPYYLFCSFSGINYYSYIITKYF